MKRRNPRELVPTLNVTLKASCTESTDPKGATKSHSPFLLLKFDWHENAKGLGVRRADCRQYNEENENVFEYWERWFWTPQIKFRLKKI